MEISRQQTLPFGEEESTCSRGDSPASHFQQPGNGKVQPITVISGQKCCERFAKLVPDGSWAKTFSELLIGREDWFSNACTLTWKMRGTRSRRLYFQLAASEHRTSDTECGLLPTPTATDKGSGEDKQIIIPGSCGSPHISSCSEDGVTPNSNSKRCQECNVAEKPNNEKIWDCKNSQHIQGWSRFPTQSPICSRRNGFPIPMDGITFSKWRSESIKAYGNAIVPQVAYRIFDTINKYESL